MFTRDAWIKKIKKAWELRSLIWLVGVRRIGKTTLVKSIAKNIHYYDCELKRNRELIENDIEEFWNGKENTIVVLDEVHRLVNPSEVLKIATDHYPSIKIIATGSSSLAASKKFQDTLTGRKVTIELRSLTEADLKLFNQEINIDAAFENTLDRRFLYGGMPANYLSEGLPEYAFEEWIDSYWAKDIQELYELRNRFAFQKFMELLFLQSGGLFEASKFTADCKVSNPSISNFLHVLEETHVVDVLRPYHKRKNSEILSTPKVYGFDTGLVCYVKGWSSIRKEDRGILWEHFVLNEMKAQLQSSVDIFYWRDKKKREVDFIIKKKRSQSISAIETKWQAANFKADNLIAFRELHPEGENFLVTNDITEPYIRNFGALKVHYLSLQELLSRFI